MILGTPTSVSPASEVLTRAEALNATSGHSRVAARRVAALNVGHQVLFEINLKAGRTCT